nr:unnamed protein product [Callosobruchus analis]
MQLLLHILNVTELHVGHFGTTKMKLLARKITRLKLLILGSHPHNHSKECIVILQDLSKDTISSFWSILIQNGPQFSP